jgi:hypothetical protein
MSPAEPLESLPTKLLTRGEIADLLDGLALAGHRPTVAQLGDLADIVRGGASRASHASRARQVGRSSDAVADSRRALASIPVPGNHLRLVYVRGISTARPSMVIAARPSDLVDVPGPLPRSPQAPYRTGRARSGVSSPQNPQGAAAGGGAALLQSHACVRIRPFGAHTVTTKVGVTPGGVPGSARSATAPSRDDGARAAEPTPDRLGKNEPRIRTSPALRVEPRAGSGEWAELRAVAVELLGEARTLGVLESDAAYASPSYVAAGLYRLAEQVGGLDPAVRDIRRVMLRRSQLQADVDDGAPAPRFPGRAVLFFVRPRAAVRGRGFVAGLLGSWNADGWPAMPTRADVPGWSPVEPDPAPFGPLDPTAAELLERRAARLAATPAPAADSLADDEFTARIELSADPTGPGARGLRGILAGCLATTTVLESFGPDFVGRVVAWRRAAERGSGEAIRNLARLDSVAVRHGKVPGPAERAPMHDGVRLGLREEQLRLRMFPRAASIVRYKRGARKRPVIGPGPSAAPA